MKNEQGKTVNERLKRDIEHAKKIENAEQRKLHAYMIMGAAELAVDFGMITYTEWGKHTNEVFKIM
ncbi:MAG: hypothetical protein IKL46_04980 [Clostridia bacterium]|nr:hypothetical protein [Clostridia bacterium]